MIKLLTFSLALLATTLLKAELYFIYGLDELISRSKIIIETEFQCQDDDVYIFTHGESDTITIHRQQMIYFHERGGYDMFCNPEILYYGIYESDKCILFLENKQKENPRLVSSGIIIIKDRHSYSQAHLWTELFKVRSESSETMRRSIKCKAENYRRTRVNKY